MIRQVGVVNYLGESKLFELAKPDNSGFAVISVDGLGPAKADVNMTDMVTSDGSIFNSARITNRNIVLELQFVGPDIEKNRHETYKYFPLKKRVDLVIWTDERVCATYGYVESNEPDIFSKTEGTSISILCPDPFFYSAGEDGLHTTIFYSVEPKFEFPFSNESLTEKLLNFGNILNVTERSIYYDGDGEIGVTIRMHAIGDVSMITIYNTGTREVMKIDTNKLEELTGSGLVNGDDIIISTVRGAKSIQLLRGGIYTNILNTLDKDSDWFQLAKGDNIFAYTAEEGLTNLQFKIENRSLYEGV